MCCVNTDHCTTTGDNVRAHDEVFRLELLTDALQKKSHGKCPSHLCVQLLMSVHKTTGRTTTTDWDTGKTTTWGLEELIPKCFEQVRLWHLWRRSVHWGFPGALLRMSVLKFFRGTRFMFAGCSNMGSHPRKLCFLSRHPPHVVRLAVRLIDGQVAETAPHEICLLPVPGPPREEACGGRYRGRGGEWPQWLTTEQFALPRIRR